MPRGPPPPMKGLPMPTSPVAVITPLLPVGLPTSLLIEQALTANVEQICVVVWPGDETRYAQVAGTHGARIASKLSMASGFSSLAMTGVCLSAFLMISLAISTSSGRRTKLTPM